MRSSARPTVDRDLESTTPPSATRVFVWRTGSRATLEAQLQACRNAGWRIERCVARVVEGPAYGALVVLRRADPPVRNEDAPTGPAQQRTARRPRIRPLPSPPAMPNAPAA